MRFERCSSCDGFVARGRVSCPHCSSATPSVATGGVKVGVGATLLGGALAFTLMACYGMPPCPDNSPRCGRPMPPPDTTATDGGSAIEPVPAPGAVAPVAK